MKLSRRTNTIILWTISLALMVSMVIAFTPTLGNFFGGGQNTRQEALTVNGNSISEIEVARAQQNPPFNLTLDGEAGEDLDILLVESLIDNEIIQQAAADTRVTNREVNEAVNEFRDSQGVGGSSNDRAYLALIGRFGFDDAGFRNYYREQLKVEKYQEGLTEGVSVSDEEVQAFYNLNENAYQTEERIRARAIVVADEETANEAYARAQAEDFATLAEELSTERADQGGALGAASGSSDPQPVGRAALPTEVANAAFGLQGEGLTEVINAGSNYYVVNVEEFIAAGTRPLEEVEEEVREDALEAKRAAVVEETLGDLRANAEVELSEANTLALTLENPAVAVVGDEEILRSELARAVYLNPQIQQSLSGESASLVTGLFKPTILEQLIEQKLAYQGAQTLDAQFIGTEGQVAQAALAYVSRDATASEEELQEYYDGNLDRFTLPAQAVVTRVNFESEADASAFRSTLLDGEELQAAAEANSGEVLDLGTVRPGTLQPEIDSALFETDAFSELSESSEQVSDVLVISEPVVEDEAATDETAESQDAAASAETDAETEGEEIAPDEDGTAESQESGSEDSADAETTDEDASGEATDDSAETADTAEAGDAEEVADEIATEEIATEEVYVVLVAERTPERVRSFEEVRAQVEDTVLQSKRSELQTAWLDGLREDITVENLSQAEVDEPAFETTPLEDETDGETGEATAPGDALDGSAEPVEDLTTPEDVTEDSADTPASDETGTDETQENGDAGEDESSD